jgi:hypothetical protein
LRHFNNGFTKININVCGACAFSTVLTAASVHEPEIRSRLLFTVALMSHEDRSYAYTSLRHPDSIRLIELLPGVKRSPLVCKIIQVRRADNLIYEALSYVWGEAEVLHTIEEITLSTLLSITVNLHDALQAIRYEHDSRMLWIDAMCINQLDLPEKGHQVASMGRIYGDAWRVVVWLGSPKFAISRIIDILTEIVDSVGNHTAIGHSYNARVDRVLTRLTASKFLEQSWYVLRVPLHFVYCIVPIKVRSFCNFMACVVNCKRYTRVWVVQEFILAQDLQFQLADGILPPALLENAFDALSSISIARRPNTSSYRFNTHVSKDETKRSVPLFSYRRRRISGGFEHTNMSLISCVIDLAQGRECKDARDRLYAMLAVAEDSLRIEPDYQVPLSAALNKLATRSLLSGDLFVLHASGIRPNHDPDLSSFAPSVMDWVGMTSRLNTSELGFRAANVSLVSVSPRPANSVSLRGVRVDTVKRMRDTLLDHIFSDSYALLNSPYTGITLGSILYRTMTLYSLDLFTQNYFVLPEEFRNLVSHGDIHKFFQVNAGLYENRDFFDTEQGYFGLGPSWMKPDDQVVIFDGGATPLILRNVKSEDESPGDTLQLVGDCFLLGWMHGDYFGHTVVDELPQESSADGEGGPSDGDKKKYLVKEWFTLI